MGYELLLFQYELTFQEDISGQYKNSVGMVIQCTVSLWRYLISKDLSVSFRGTVPAISSSTTRFGSQSFYFIGKSEELPVNKNYKHWSYVKI